MVELNPAVAHDAGRVVSFDCCLVELNPADAHDAGRAI